MHVKNVYFVLSGAGNLLNAILDPILIFFFHFGIGGAAVATVISEYVNNVVNLMLIINVLCRLSSCNSRS